METLSCGLYFKIGFCGGGDKYCYTVMDGEKYLALVLVYGLPRERTLQDRRMEIFIILQFGVLSDRINEVCLIS